MNLVELQKELLIKICQTNGGGISTISMDGWQLKAVHQLHDLGLVQGKSGNESTAVHTKQGLELYRTLTKQS